METEYLDLDILEAVVAILLADVDSSGDNENGDKE